MTMSCYDAKRLEPLSAIFSVNVKTGKSESIQSLYAKLGSHSGGIKR